MQVTKLLTMLVLVPAVAAAQQDPVERLREVLPATVAERVIGIVTEAQSQGLPGYAVANRALEVLAKGKNAETAGAAARAFAAELAASRGAFVTAGRTPDANEIEAGAAAMAMGVDGKTVSDLARNAERSGPLAVAVTVLGALVQADLPVGVAYEAVLDRFNAGADNSELAALPGEAGRLIAEGHRPAEVGRALASARSGLTILQGPPASVPRNNGRPEPPRRPEVPPAPPQP